VNYRDGWVEQIIIALSGEKLGEWLMCHRTIAVLGLVVGTLGLSTVDPTAVHAQASAAATQGSPTAQTAPATATDDSASLLEIVVTAQRRSEKMVDVPISVTALGAEQMATANVQNLSDIAQLTPALRFDTRRSSYSPRSEASARASRPRAAARTSASTLTDSIRPTQSRPTCNSSM
jgi:outer membrane receptor for ferric coprogen and ferric-rhodotorulic acid